MPAVNASKLKTLLGGRHRPPRKPLAYPLKRLILTLATSLIVLTAGSIGGFNYFTARDAAQSLSDEIIEDIAEQTQNRITGYLQPIVPTLSLARRLAQSDPRYGFLSSAPPSEASGRARAKLFLQVLKSTQSNPQISMFFYGDRFGHYWAAYRDPANRYHIIHRWVEHGETCRRVFRVSDDERTWTPDSEENTPFDCRNRQWYTAARTRGSFAFTQPYLFREDMQPGLTGALPLYDAHRRLLGVFGADLQLNAIDQFLKTVARSQRIVYVLSEDRPGTTVMMRILASSRPGAAFEAHELITPGGRFKLPLAIDSGDAVLGAVARRLSTWESDADARAKSASFSVSGRRYLGTFVPLPASGLNWNIAVVVPREEVLLVVDRNTRTAVGVFLFVMVVAFIFSPLGASAVAEPLRTLRDEMQRVGNFDLSEEPFPASSVLEVCQAGQALDHMKSSLRSFRRYVPADLVRQYLYTGTEARLGGELASVTIFFADLIGFSSIAEQLAPDVLVDMMADYLQDMEQIIRHHSGLLDKISGDAVMALFGSPIRPLPRYAERAACAAALDYAARSRQRGDAGAHEAGINEAGIGIHTGEALVGNIGSRERMVYTAMGDAVNVASRIEGLTRLYSVPVLVSEATYLGAREHFEFRMIDRVAVKGRRGSVSIYELICRAGEMSEHTRTLCSAYNEGLELYMRRQWSEAGIRFAHALSMEPGDAPSRLLLDRCREYEAAPPPESWDGVFIAPTK